MKGIYVIALLLCFQSFGQVEVGYLFEEMPSDSTPKRTVSTHTSLKPSIRLQSDTRENYLKINGLADWNYMQHNLSDYKIGLGAELTSKINNKWFFRLASVQGLYSDSILIPKS